MKNLIASVVGCACLIAVGLSTRSAASAREADEPFWEVLPPIHAHGRYWLGAAELDGRGRLWVTSRAGLHYWHNGRWNCWASGATTLLRVVQGSLYYVFYPQLGYPAASAVYRVDGRRKQLVCRLPRSLRQGSHYSIRLDGEGRVYVPTRDGVHVYDPPPAAEAIAQAGALAPDLLDDRPDAREATARKILALGHGAEPGLEPALSSPLPQLRAAAAALKKRFDDAEQVLKYGPWTSWQCPALSMGTGSFADDRGSLYVCMHNKSLWLKDGVLVRELDHEKLAGFGQVLSHLPLAEGAVLFVRDRDLPFRVLDFKEGTTHDRIPGRIAHVSGVPDHLLRDPKRLAQWVHDCVQILRHQGSLAMLLKDWTPEEISAGIVLRKRWVRRGLTCHHMETSRPGEVFSAKPQGHIDYLRGGEVYTIDWRHGVLPGYVKRTFTDSRGGFWVVSANQVARYWPGRPGVSPVPAPAPSPRFEVVPLAARHAVQTPNGDIHAFPERHGGRLCRWADGQWLPLTTAPVVHKRGNLIGITLDDKGRLVSGRRREALARSYLAGSRAFYCSRPGSYSRCRPVVLDDGLWMLEPNKKAVHHFDGKQWETLRASRLPAMLFRGGRGKEVRLFEARFRPTLLFRFGGDRLGVVCDGGVRGYGLAMVDRTNKQLRPVSTERGIRVLTPYTSVWAWPKGLAKFPEPSVLLAFPAPTTVNVALAPERLGEYRDKGFREFFGGGLPPKVATVQDRWLSGSRFAQWGGDGTVILQAGSVHSCRRFAWGFSIPLDLSLTPAWGLRDCFVTTTKDGELWVFGQRRRVVKNMSHRDRCELVRWKPSPIEAKVLWTKGRVCALSATRKGEPCRASGFLWKVDAGRWHMWPGTKPLDLGFLANNAEVLQVIAVSHDGRDLSKPTRSDIPRAE